MTSRQSRRFEFLLPAVLALIGMALLWWEPFPLQVARHALFDQYQRWNPRTYHGPPVRIIDIDEESLKRIGQWPWPRTRLAELVGQLKEKRVAAIAFDIVFAESDRTSPRNAAKAWAIDSEAIRGELERLPDHDEVFANSLREAPVVTGFTLGNSGHAPKARGEEQLSLASRHVLVGGFDGSGLHRFSQATPSIPILAQASAGQGALTFVPDHDGVIRRVPLVLGLGSKPVPTLTAELLRISQKTPNHLLVAADGAPHRLAEVRIGRFRIPTNAHGEIWMHYSGTEPGRYVPAWKLIEGKALDISLDDHLVIVGTSAPGLLDLRFSALGHVIPGVEVHAQAIEQILSGHLLVRPSWVLAAETALVALGTAFAALLGLRTRALTAALATLCLAVALSSAGWASFQVHGILIDTAFPVAMTLLAFVVGSLIHHFVTEQDQRWVRNAFSRYVSPNRVDYLVNHPDAMALGGQRQECSFVFTDLTDFTHLMESIDPAKAVSVLNRYLDGMIGIAFRHEGTLDRIVGDAVAIMFSAPVAQDDHPARALACAVEMDEFAARFAEEAAESGCPLGTTRIGVHTGEVIVGNFGGSALFDYRALGDVVNTASRLEGANKYLGTTLCLSAATLAGCRPAPAVRPIGRLKLKGRNTLLTVYEPIVPRLAAERAPTGEYCRAFEMLLERTESSSQPPLPETGSRNAEAMTAFENLARRYPTDPLVRLHLSRLHAGETGDIIVLENK